ncbi:hypothetical protein BB559_003965 [Furculomyces boomerangus]|uniref:Isocitrate dehydrogenase [NAD] subunit 1, mitochondrial n=2 Tax=Harpellales TaxID=61421 RepID=A0A2T9YHL1_9FUNG|nr:hypothetical protein BB559_003965 [Furculomyces boomerangus]PVZ99049.1 hypothetical protein BB558_004942 [Smittium angustum]
MIGLRSLRTFRSATRYAFASRMYGTEALDITGPKEYGGKYTVTLIPGDGIGQEVAQSVKHIFSKVGAPIHFEQYNVSGESDLDDLSMTKALESLKRNKIGLKGILFTPISKGHSSFNVFMRKELDIYASVSLAKNIPGLESRHHNVDLVIIRENTEGEYSGLEHMSVDGVVESIKIITREKTERIARYAFDYAKLHNRKKVTCVHKANIMKLTDGLFLKTCREVSKEYKYCGIEFNEMIVDNTAMQLVGKPQQFDVMVMPNLYGTIVSNIAAGLINGVGFIPGGNFGRNYAIFEPGARHVGKDIQGRNIANPTAMILSGVMMLRHLDLNTYADAIENAVKKTIGQSHVLTADLGGSALTTEFTDQVVANLF